jgi:hypothetical protein
MELFARQASLRLLLNYDKFPNGYSQFRVATGIEQNGLDSAYASKPTLQAECPHPGRQQRAQQIGREIIRKERNHA